MGAPSKDANLNRDHNHDPDRDQVRAVGGAFGGWLEVYRFYVALEAKRGLAEVSLVVELDPSRHCRLPQPLPPEITPSPEIIPCPDITGTMCCDARRPCCAPGQRATIDRHAITR